MPTGLPSTAVLAHQGGWDEILFVLTPLVVFALLLRAARRRVDRMEADETGEPSAADTSDRT